MATALNLSLTPEQCQVVERHRRIRASTAAAISEQLKGGPWQSYATGLGIRLQQSNRYSHPDVLVVQGDVELEVGDQAALLNPQVIIEIVSNVPEKFDYSRFRRYKLIESLQEYVLVEQDEPALERYVRQPDGAWASTFVEGLDREFAFATVPVRVPTADVYAGVTFPEPTAR